jgi:hypothetical protein
MFCSCCDWILCDACSKDFSGQDFQDFNAVKIPTSGFYANWSSDNYEMVVEPIDAVLTARKELAMLEAQACQLRYTMERRRCCEGANWEGDDVSSMLGHYKSVLEDITQQMVKLSYGINLIE